MVQGKCELMALCLGIIGLIGAVAVTGLPMWKVTAFIGENIIVMETRWEGLWMTCFRQANIHMQCKVYDSLLFLPPDLQAARGLTCCALALSGVGLLVSLVGLRCTLCLRDQPRAKSLIAMAAGVMQILASVCVITPVSWTAHTIIRDFYNPLLIDAQRRELGEALYIGWVTSAFLLASGIIFLCRRVDPKSGSFHARPPANKPILNRLQTFNSIRHQPLVQSNSLSIQQPSPSVFSYAITLGS
uniref:Claudin n=1 Tax=Sinocyclocheilus rhinocerous TaxID=307959 RepID=A0A673JS51_9TELE